MKKLCALLLLANAGLMATPPTTAAPSVKTWKPSYNPQTYDQNYYFNVTEEQEEESLSDEVQNKDDGYNQYLHQYNENSR